MTLLGRVTAMAQRRPLVFAIVVGSVFASAGFGAAVTISENTFQAVFGNIQTVNTNLQVSSTALSVQKAAAAASADSSGTATEMGTSASGGANTALTRAHWVYKAVVEETAVASITTGTYKVELFLDDTSKGALYMTQGTSNGAAVEGATFRWSLGADLPTGDSAYRVEITQV